MKEALRVLIVEDSEDDALLLARLLERGSYTLTHKRVETPSALQTALEQHSWDIVISDYSMPKFSGLDALRIVQQIKADLPFIVVSGRIGEETAVATMKAGAHDYLMKGNLTRLVPAVQRELSEAKVRRARQQAEEQLRILSRVVEQNPVAVAITNTEGFIEYVNPRFSQLTGYATDEVTTGKCHILQMHTPPTQDYAQAWHLIRTNNGWKGEICNQKKSGEKCWVNVTISPIYTHTGAISHYAALAEDISDRKRAEEEREQVWQRQQQQHDTLLQLAVDPAIARGELDQALRTISREAATTLKISRVSIWRCSSDQRNFECISVYDDEVTERGLGDIFEITSCPEYFRKLGTTQSIPTNDVYSDNRVQEFTAAYWSSLGTRATIEAPIRLHGKVIGVVRHEHTTSPRQWQPDEVVFASQIANLVTQAFLNADLAKAYESEAQRRREAETLQSVTQTLSATLELPQVLERILSELEKVVPYDSASVQQLKGKRLEIIGGRGFPNLGKLLGLTFDITTADNPNKDIINSRTPLILDDAPVLYSNFKRAPHAEAGIRSWLGVPLIFAERPIGMIALDKQEPGFFTEAHTRMAEAFAAQAAIAIENAKLFAQVEQRAIELTRALQQQQEFDHLKSQFIQNVSHELRTPLAIARGYAELLDSGELGALQQEQREPIAIIARRLRMLTKLVDDINAILEVEGKSPEHNLVYLGQLIERVITESQPTLTKAHLNLSTDIAPNLPPVFGHATQLQRVIDNLLSNAIKFTPSYGHISVRLFSVDASLVLEIKDTGIGIANDELERIFERFYQADGSMSRRYGGTGLGLALVKEIVEAHGGTVEVESKSGKGSVFRVTLPLPLNSA